MEELSKDLLRVSRMAQMCVGKVIKKYNITVAEEPFFMAVHFHNGATQDELTSIVGVDKAMTTRVLHSLEKKNLVKRVSDPQDKRQNRVYQTEKAVEMSEEFVSELIHLNEVFIHGISRKSFENFMQTLDVLEENISEFLKAGTQKNF